MNISLIFQGSFVSNSLQATVTNIAFPLESAYNSRIKSNSHGQYNLRVVTTHETDFICGR